MGLREQGGGRGGAGAGVGAGGVGEVSLWVLCGSLRSSRRLLLLLELLLLQAALLLTELGSPVLKPNLSDGPGKTSG